MVDDEDAIFKLKLQEVITCWRTIFMDGFGKIG